MAQKIARERLVDDDRSRGRTAVALVEGTPGDDGTVECLEESRPHRRRPKLRVVPGPSRGQGLDSCDPLSRQSPGSDVGESDCDNAGFLRDPPLELRVRSGPPFLEGRGFLTGG